MRNSMIRRIGSLVLVLLFVSACTTSNVLTVHKAGNYTSNVNPYGSSGQ